jgi:tRNA A37 threonylcarbamoyladenosine modification protein TsaB
MAATAGVTGRVLVINNAYKGEVYSQLFTVSEVGVPSAVNKPLVTGIDDALARVAGIESLVVTGDAVSALAESIESYGQAQSPGSNWMLKQGAPFLAETVARLAGSKEPVTPEALQACYVRPPDIKIKPQGDNLIQGRSNVSVPE